MKPFDFYASVTSNKKYIMTEENEHDYESFLVNRTLSYFKDCVLLANEMNKYHKIDNKLQYDFFINTIRKQSRFSKWQKANDKDIITAVKAYYGFNQQKAEQAVSILSDDQKKYILKKVSKGGRTNS